MSENSRRTALKLVAAGSAVALAGVLPRANGQQPGTTEEVTFDAIDKAVAKVELKAYEAGGARAVTKEDMAAAGPLLEKICPIYQSIRGILIALSTFPLIPKTWRAALKTFVQVMDVLCPQ